jgi:hypothetical protein
MLCNVYSVISVAASKWPERESDHPSPCSAVVKNSSIRFCGRQHDAPKRWYPTTSLHGLIAQKTSTWIFIAVKTRKLATSISVLTAFVKELRTRHELVVMYYKLLPSFYWSSVLIRYICYKGHDLILRRIWSILYFRKVSILLSTLRWIVLVMERHCFPWILCRWRLFHRDVVAQSM